VGSNSVLEQPKVRNTSRGGEEAEGKELRTMKPLYLYEVSTYIATYVAAESAEEARCIAEKSWEEEIPNTIYWNELKAEECIKVSPEDGKYIEGNAYYDENKYGKNRTFPCQKVVHGISGIKLTTEIKERINQLEEELKVLKMCYEDGRDRGEMMVTKEEVISVLDNMKPADLRADTSCIDGEVMDIPDPNLLGK
jgi:hypothetical protein